MRVVCVAGARPNFVKVKPVVDALERRGVEVVLVHTGQHYDPMLSDAFFEDLDLRRPDRELGAGPGTQAEQTAAIMLAFEPLLADVSPDAVLVVGDVTSTLACALVTAKATVPLAHVEAGLRSGDWTMPEEVNRVVTDRLSRWLFAPSSDAVANLAAEGITDGVHLVGNVMVDSLLANLDRARARAASLLADLGLTAGRYGLVTLHRPANVDDADAWAGILAALGELAVDLPLVWPAHPRTRARLDAGTPPGVAVLGPLGYLDFVALESSARIVLTDSGGVQEETTVLGVPCVTLRDVTERPVTVEQGTNVVAGRDPARIVGEVRRLLSAPAPAPAPDAPPEVRRPELWDGRAAERVADVLAGSAG